MIKLIHKIIFVFFIFFSIEVKSKEVGIGDVNSKVTIKVFSSLTCPACANFHSKIFYQIKEEFIDKGLVRFEHHPFPLDLAALNAEMIVRCHVDNIKKFELLGKIYEKQKLWAVGSDINKINDSIKKIGLESNLNNKDMDNCLKDENGEDRPFAFITLGGCSDSSYLDGHNYTYEGSMWGKIVDVLIECKCMNLDEVLQS